MLVFIHGDQHEAYSYTVMLGYAFAKWRAPRFPRCKRAATVPEGKCLDVQSRQFYWDRRTG